MATSVHTYRKLLLYSVIGTFQLFAVNSGLVHEGAGVGAVLTFTQPLFVFCLAVPILKERITVVRLSGATLGFLGVVILSIERVSSFRIGSTVVMILGGFLWAFLIIYYKKFLSHVDSLVVTFFQLSVGALILLPFGIFSGSFALPTESAYLWAMVYSSVGALAIGTTLWLFLLKEEEATVLSGSSFVIPVIALLFGWQLLGENVQLEAAVGVVLTLIGVLIINFRLKKARAKNRLH